MGGGKIKRGEGGERGSEREKAAAIAASCGRRTRAEVIRVGVVRACRVMCLVT